MASDRQIAANRRNSQRSTGPRTAVGKARVRRNALRHGLAATILRDPALKVEVDQLAAVICGKGADPAKREQALIVAESEALLSRIRAARVDLIEQMSPTLPGQEADASQLTLPNPGQLLTQLLRLERYESAALSRRTRAAARVIFSARSGRT